MSHAGSPRLNPRHLQIKKIQIIDADDPRLWRVAASQGKLMTVIDQKFELV